MLLLEEEKQWDGWRTYRYVEIVGYTLIFELCGEWFNYIIIIL